MISVFGISKSIRYLNWDDTQRRSCHQRASPRPDRVLSHILLVLWRKAIVRSELVELTSRKKI